MSGMLRVAKQELKETRQDALSLLYTFVMVVGPIGVSGFLSLLIRGFGLGGLFLEPIIKVSPLVIINVIPFVYSVGLIFLLQFGMGADIFNKVEKVVEAKVERSTKRARWLGKTLAISSVTYIACVLAVCLSVPLINLLITPPTFCLLNPTSLLYLFLIFPFFCFFFNALIGIIHLSTKNLLPGNFVSLIITAPLFIIPILLVIVKGPFFPMVAIALMFSVVTVCLALVVSLIYAKIED
ncbi:MAG TPA: hypothetical protein HA348_07415 [Thermoplasmata archaeon]|nr:hypothetical protein [Thermoplasmata archaeon]